MKPVQPFLSKQAIGECTRGFQIGGALASRELSLGTGAVYLVESDSGHVVLKAYLQEEVNPRMLESQLRFSAFLHQTLGTAARPLPTESGSYSFIPPSACTVVTAHSYLHHAEHSEYTAELASLIGRSIAGAHEASLSYPGFADYPTLSPDELLNAPAREILRHALRLGIRVSRVSETLERVEASLAPLWGREMVIAHGDVHPSNLALTRQGAVWFDFDHSRAISPAFDLALVRLISTGRSVGHRFLGAYVAAYEHEVGRPHPDLDLVPPLAAALHLKLIAHHLTHARGKYPIVDRAYLGADLSVFCSFEHVRDCYQLDCETIPAQPVLGGTLQSPGTNGTD